MLWVYFVLYIVLNSFYRRLFPQIRKNTDRRLWPAWTQILPCTERSPINKNNRVEVIFGIFTSIQRTVFFAHWQQFVEIMRAYVAHFVRFVINHLSSNAMFIASKISWREKYKRAGKLFFWCAVTSDQWPNRIFLTAKIDNFSVLLVRILAFAQLLCLMEAELKPWVIYI